jgi:hypothetical protein
MVETSSNVEFAHRIHEHGHQKQPPQDRRGNWIEIAEAFVLAAVAIATAWSSYQAAKWDARSAEHYSAASRITVRSQGKTTLAGQDRLYDITTFSGWVAAETGGQHALAKYYERRFRPEYAVAFAAWRKLDPFNNPSAPPGPIFMPDYVNANARESAELAEEATGHFEQAVSNRETGDDYVRLTVLLATVLLLTALSQRFHSLGPRLAVLAVAAVLLVMSIYSIAALARA